MAEGKKISELPYISGGMEGAVNRNAMFPLEVEGSNAKIGANDISGYIGRLASLAGAANFQTVQVSNRISSLLNIGDSFIQFSSDFGVSDGMPLGALLLDTETKMLCVAIDHPSSNPSQFRWLVIAKDCKCGEGENGMPGGGIKPVGVIRPCMGGIPDFEWHYIDHDFDELDDPEGSPPKGAFEATKYIGDDVVKQEYAPKDLDIWFNYFNNTYWIWQRNEWQPFDFAKYNRKIKIFYGSLYPQLGAQKTLQFSELSNFGFHSVAGLSTDGITSRPEIGSYVIDEQQQIFGVITQVFESSVYAVTLGSLGGGGGGIDLSAYRTAADEDVINNFKVNRSLILAGTTLNPNVGGTVNVWSSDIPEQELQKPISIGDLVYDASGTLGVIQNWISSWGGVAAVQTIAANASGGGGGNAALTISLNGQANFSGNPYTPSGSPSQEIALTINPFDFNPGQNAGGIVSLYAASQSGFASKPSLGADGFTDPAGKNCYKEGNNVFYNWEDIVNPQTLAFYIYNSASGNNIYVYNAPTNEKRIFYFYGDNADTQITFSSAAQPFNYIGASFQAGLNCMAIGFLANNVFKASQFYNLSGGQI